MINELIVLLMAGALLTPVYLLNRWTMRMLRYKHNLHMQIIRLRDGEGCDC